MIRVSKLWVWERRTNFLDGQLSQPLALVDGLLQRVAVDQTSKQTTSKGVTGTVSVFDLIRVQGMDRVFVDLVGVSGRVVGDSDGWFQTVGDDHGSVLLGIDLWFLGNVLGDFLQIGGLQTVRLSISSSFGFVTNDVVGESNGLVQDVLEELRDERSRQVQGEVLVFVSSVLT
ncbi:hypothetical protein WICPIJ_003426 [Wickerhamomyces pijperi]|uniref:Uncharacterized protein n=1 Tax=Wickerhamomyces pijperi TaxID=599730 RepID=A0A9P8TP84_WICPI|nr:hypothetical protein WICPIJ_003426 [Wickerhamomyces pijperi]